MQQIKYLSIIKKNKDYITTENAARTNIAQRVLSGLSAQRRIGKSARGIYFHLSILKTRYILPNTAL
jgi:hypothetical protein